MWEWVSVPRSDHKRSMGQFLSLAGTNPRTSDTNEFKQTEACKRQRLSSTCKNAIMGHELFQLRKELGTTAWLYLLTKADDDKLVLHALDPLSKV